MVTYVSVSLRKPRGRGFERRDEIIRAAETLFEQYGPETSLRDIAAAAGLSQASLFKHFSTRAELVSAVRSHIHLRLETEIEEGRPPASDVRANLDAIFRAHARLAKERPSLFSIAFPSPGHLAKLDPRRFDEAFAALPGMAKLRSALGSPPLSRLPALDLVSLSSWFTIYGLALTLAVELGHDRIKAEETITQVLDLLVGQLSAFG